MLFYLLIFFRKIISGIPSECQLVWIKIRPDVSDLGTNCLQKLLADYTRRLRVSKLSYV